MADALDLSLPKGELHPTADRILDAAEELFAERGLAGTAVRDIAARVGLTPASLYNHFESKQVLYEAVLERGIRPLLSLLQEASAGDPERDWGEHVIEAVMAHLGSRPHLPRLIQHEAVSGAAHLSRLARRWILPTLSQALAAVKREGGLARWDEEELPLLVVAWLNIVVGHFAMAPLFAEVFHEDPLSEKNLARQTRFLRKLARRISRPANPIHGTSEDPA
ncbi:MAG: TetR/AcrR family transcriptional regulator [Myxococcota bacterium]